MIIVTMNNGDRFHVEADDYKYTNTEGILEFYKKGTLYKRPEGKPRYFVEHPNSEKEIREKGTYSLKLFTNSISSIEVLND